MTFLDEVIAGKILDFLIKQQQNRIKIFVILCFWAIIRGSSESAKFQSI